MPFIYNEDRALKAKITGLTVSDLRNVARSVKVFFGMPDPELVEASYPFITITLVDINEAFERSARGRTHLGYVPEEYVDPPDGFTQLVDWPIPYNLDYQITVFTRFPQHDREITGKLLRHDRLPHRFGWLEIPEDNTIRRLDLLDVVTAEAIDQNNKRLFRKIFNVRVSAELVPSAVEDIKQVTQVEIDLIPPSRTVETIVITSDS